MSGIQIDALDRALIDALGIAPRASWEALAGVLEVDSGTLARRWRRLTANGAARIAVEPGPARALAVAVLEIECAPSALRRVVQHLSNEDTILLWDITSGARDIVAVAGATSRDVISRLVIDRLVEIAGVRAVRVALADSRVSGGNDSLGVLTHVQREGLRALSVVNPPSLEIEEVVAVRIERVLAANARASWRELAEATGLSPHRARSAVAALLASGHFQFRVRTSPSLLSEAVNAWFFAKADPGHITSALHHIERHENVRFSAAVHGRFDLVVCIRLVDMDALAEFVDRATRLAPGVRFIDRSIVIRTASA